MDGSERQGDGLKRYLTIEKSKQVAPVIAALREQADALRDEVLAQARRRLAQGADGGEVLEYATAALMKKLLHHPSVRLRKAGEAEEEDLIDVARALFGLDEDAQ